MEQVKLLMTELSPELTRLCAETLAAQDIAVTVCEKDGAKALAALSAEKPDAVLLDAFMPGLDALTVPFPVSWTVKMKKKQKETQDILSYHSQAAGCSDKARAKASGGRQPIEECGRTGL